MQNGETKCELFCKTDKTEKLSGRRDRGRGRMKEELKNKKIPLAGPSKGRSSTCL